MIADGFYIVKEGEFENILGKPKMGKFLRKFINLDRTLVQGLFLKAGGEQER